MKTVKSLLKEIHTKALVYEDKEHRTRYVYTYEIRGTIVYVGVGDTSSCSYNPWHRAEDVKQHPAVYNYVHRKDKVLKIRIVARKLNRWAALGVEQWLIQEHRPKFNKTLTPRRSVLLSTYTREGHSRTRAREKLLDETLWAPSRQTKAGAQRNRILERKDRREKLREARIEEYGSLANYRREKARAYQEKLRENPLRRTLASLQASRSYHKKKGNQDRVEELTREIEALRESLK